MATATATQTQDKLGLFEGQGVTFVIGSDRYAGTIVEVINAKTIVVQDDKSTLKSGRMASESQVYDYTRDPDAERKTYTFRADEFWRPKGSQSGYLIIGRRNTYRDPSF